MKIKELSRLLDNFNEEQELTINVEFPDIDGWTVSTGDISFDVDKDYDTLSLEIAVYLADFDYTAVWKKLEDAVTNASASSL